MGVLSLIDLYRIGMSDGPFRGSDPPTQEELAAVYMVRNMRAFQSVEKYHSREKREDAEREVEEIQAKLVRIADADQRPWKLVALLSRHLIARIDGELLGYFEDMNQQNRALFNEMGGEKFSTIKESHRFIYLLVWLALVENDSSFRDTTPVVDWERAVEEYKRHNMPDYQAHLECLYRHHP